MLLAAGAVAGERWIDALPAAGARLARGVTAVALLVGAVISGALMLPLAPVGSALWGVSSEVHDTFAEQIGWPELVQTVAEISAALPPAERARTAILTANYGEAGAINLYGPAHGLPPVISGVNSYWRRGYGDPPPQTLIVLGFRPEAAGRFFETLRPGRAHHQPLRRAERGDPRPPPGLPLPWPAPPLARALGRAAQLRVSPFG